MKNLVNKQFLVPVVVLALSYAFLDPFMVLMPTAFIYMLLALFFLGFISFALLVWHEKAYDEREHAHRAHAARFAYLAGAGILVLGIIYQALALHSVDPWLILALTVMVFAKYLGLRHAEMTN